jgi:hypothetical protein
MAVWEKPASSIFSGITDEAKWRLYPTRLGLLRTATTSRSLNMSAAEGWESGVGAAEQGFEVHGRQKRHVDGLPTAC